MGYWPGSIIVHPLLHFTCAIGKNILSTILSLNVKILLLMLKTLTVL